MNIAPLAISYEYDPCNFLKAQEFQLKRDIEGYKKTTADDLLNMQTGLFGYKAVSYTHLAVYKRQGRNSRSRPSGWGSGSADATSRSPTRW